MTKRQQAGQAEQAIGAAADRLRFAAMHLLDVMRVDQTDNARAVAKALDPLMDVLAGLRRRAASLMRTLPAEGQELP